MKFKIILTSILVAVFAFTAVSQYAPSLVLGQSPATSPATSPVTGPVTFAGLKLEGTVTYRILGRWFKSFGKVLAASGVKVTAEDRETGQKVEATTDSDGNYLFVLPSAKYHVDVEDTSAKFVPPFKNVNLKKDKDDVNFQGLKWN